MIRTGLRALKKIKRYFLISPAARPQLIGAQKIPKMKVRANFFTIEDLQAPKTAVQLHSGMEQCLHQQDSPFGLVRSFGPHNIAFLRPFGLHLCMEGPEGLLMLLCDQRPHK